MKIVFVEPRSPNLHLFSRFKLPRLGCVLLATIANEHGHDASVFVEEIQELDWDEVERADLVGISSITSTAPQAYALAAEVRKRGIKVVMGGPHVSYLPEEAIEHSDYVLAGEAENTFLELLRHLRGEIAVEKVHNLHYHDGDEVRSTPRSTVPIDVTRNPAPNFSLIRGFYEHKPLFGKRVVPIQVSRGCPFDCSFCSVTGIFGRKMRYRDVDAVMAELAKYDDKSHHVFFYDDNFAASPERAKALLRAMAKKKTRFNWSTQMRADAARCPELLSLMKKTHCDTVYVGIESVDPRNLEESRKLQDIDEVRVNLRRFSEHKVNVHGMFVLGFESDETTSWKATVDFARDAGVTTIQALILTPLPGSRTYEKFKNENRILFKDWSLYDCHHVVFRHPNFSPAELQQAHIEAHRAFYSKRRFLSHFVRGDILNAIICHYARKLQNRWVDHNSSFLRALELLKSGGELPFQLKFTPPISIR